jgi:hypothetical protein
MDAAVCCDGVSERFDFQNRCLGVSNCPVLLNSPWCSDLEHRMGWFGVVDQSINQWINSFYFLRWQMRYGHQLRFLHLARLMLVFVWSLELLAGGPLIILSKLQCTVWNIGNSFCNIICPTMAVLDFPTFLLRFVVTWMQRMCATISPSLRRNECTCWLVRNTVSGN